ncbi:carbohydrate ABC transporter permease [Microbacterium ulmi]|uniref:Carbohydrate ABC transporter permease n=1 Tax=Microbacterium ulmi TaxID=179095 RepID=A0A7Y2LZN5_9MICO|nr:carbohydrate ABC transporter permease [Microbacterium ulmi]NII69906.1 multiple sugar transport system permease protein [Microbacterium ulmi]NNH03826.1 carbohydrate ABC transporter permease [Microbacterium ulmi]
MKRSLALTGKYSSLVLASLVVLVPIGVIVFASFKTRKEYGTTGPLVPPSNWLNFDNFVEAFTSGRMALGFWNTGFILIFSIIGTILIGTMTAYALDRFDFRGKRIVFFLFLTATLIPGVTTQVATFQIVKGLGLINTPWSAIILYMGTDIISIYIFIQFMQSIPKSLDEAALVDGASRFTIYRKIILPLLAPAIATVVIIKGIGIYNEFYVPFLYIPSRDLSVISTALFNFKGPYGAHWETIAAGTMIVIIPTVVVFLALQKWIYNGVTAGATK